ncbi:uncharacterized protein N7473_000632 [Penicillium subrubescens]|uniref:DUF3669 domain-containing protein n=1 Tax=Penicillium subrubescens TaxID=1316194 RepID=A0A1Q5T0Y6_9EURO|nr:uncharacterized protein N7473_000632 [Penicillium subrubescens]KAJ5911329.1 hypothetical protein N7473_000632 [Penicillium subrubescens]OKO93938.1 hypothetical protein PENSUB_12217 [Penicillium subrubescens]
MSHHDLHPNTNERESPRQLRVENDLEKVSNYAILTQCLSLNLVILTSSSFARLIQEARTRPELQSINEIGVGLQGAVFEQVGERLVFKKEKPENENLPSNLQNEYQMHSAVSDAFQCYGATTSCRVRVPRAYEFISRAKEDQFWNDVFPTIPSAYQEYGDVVKMERILPLPKVVRKALLAHFYGSPGQLDSTELERALGNTKNKHCLARVYLGQTTGPIARDSISLRNFPLYLNTMNDFVMDVKTLAKEVGKAYAIMHWSACVNSDDVEFVLGTSIVQRQGSDAEPLGLQHRRVGLYLLDFGQCEKVDLWQEPDVVYQAFKGAMVTGDNRLFIPNCQSTPDLFAEFRSGYCEAGELILAERKLEDRFDMEDFMREYEEYAGDFL